MHKTTGSKSTNFSSESRRKNWKKQIKFSKGKNKTVSFKLDKKYCRNLKNMNKCENMTSLVS